ncbi:unnamed protein product [Pleuronectes platessa]|uniref:Uncharacterized protein n=1 Tax=Pleuronectes platessa TaxID=8262 RepID=A0A9N7VSU4_PLEPL|nr:unnamed protein product [Pleuronectes platessa]
MGLIERLCTKECRLKQASLFHLQRYTESSGWILVELGGRMRWISGEPFNSWKLLNRFPPNLGGSLWFRRSSFNQKMSS